MGLLGGRSAAPVEVPIDALVAADGYCPGKARLIVTPERVVVRTLGRTGNAHDVLISQVTGVSMHRYRGRLYNVIIDVAGSRITFRCKRDDAEAVRSTIAGLLT